MSETGVFVRGSLTKLALKSLPAGHSGKADNLARTRSSSSATLGKAKGQLDMPIGRDIMWNKGIH